MLDQTNQGGIIANYLNSLASGLQAASPVTIAQGAAYVAGIPYVNDAARSLTVTTPVVGTTGHLIVLRADYTAQTVRIVDKASADGTAAIPAVTQTANSLWEVALWSYTITTGGVIGSWTDKRVFIAPQGQLTFYTFNNPRTGAMHIQSETASVGGSSSAVISFFKPFSQTPAVIISPVNALSQYGNVYVSAVSATDFTVTNNSVGLVNFHYIALGLN